MMNLKEKRDKLIEKTNKMNKIRNEKIKKFKLYEARLGNDSKRLVSQYN